MYHKHMSKYTSKRQCVCKKRKLIALQKSFNSLVMNTEKYNHEYIINNELSSCKILPIQINMPMRYAGN